MVKKIMYTCSHGKDLFDRGKRFWAWDEETLEESEFVFEIKDGYDIEDLGLYYVKDVSKVNCFTENKR